jgi:hypothetical protein
VLLLFYYIALNSAAFVAVMHTVDIKFLANNQQKKAEKRQPVWRLSKCKVKESLHETYCFVICTRSFRERET